MTCNYRFPAHPADMFKQTPCNVPQVSRHLRAQMIEMIATVSAVYTQEQLDDNVFVDCDRSGGIIGLDLSKLFGLPFEQGRKIRLGDMTQHNWACMRVMRRGVRPPTTGQNRVGGGIQ